MFYSQMDIKYTLEIVYIISGADSAILKVNLNFGGYIV